MLIPLIANGPLQGPPPTPTPGRGAEKDRATQDAMKDAFGTLFQEGNVTKSIAQTPKAQDANRTAEPETTKDDAGMEATVYPDGEAETEYGVATDPFVEDTSDQLDPDLQIEPNQQAQINAADTGTDVMAAQQALPLSMASNPEAENGRAANTDHVIAPAVNTVVRAAQMATKEGLPPGQQKPRTVAVGPVTPHGNGVASAEDAVENIPGETAKAERQTATNAPTSSATTAPQAPPVVARQPVDPLHLSKRLITEIDASALDDQPLVFESRATGGTTAAQTVPPPALLQRTDLPQHIAMQIAASAQRGGTDRPVDIVLNPAELGRVRLSLSSTDGVMSVTVIAERPETLDLMRRHIDMLAQEFLSIGYGKAQFSFGGGHSGQTGQNDGEAGFSSSGGSGQHDPMTATPDLNHTPILISDRLDIRL
ncbi:hook-length control protein FliK [Roseovarius lutimaris]|uniref:Hook-length control protein FliK n=2 Tax=Roseovarius lutimaris TaxID=1005928 RepID=A0A1I5ET42_9RHOB|nr:hook-length control protein FliK [Roseovarius lutimaris]